MPNTHTHSERQGTELFDSAVSFSIDLQDVKGKTVSLSPLSEFAFFQDHQKTFTLD